MEWVETNAKSVEEAKDILLDQLGVDEQDAEFEILEEPRPGLFGRTCGNARVRARIAPKAPRGKEERRKRAPKTREKKAADPVPSAATQPTASPAKSRSAEVATPKAERVSQERPSEPIEDRPRLDIDIAKTESAAFLTSLLESFGAEGTVAVEVNEQGDLQGRIDGTGLGRLIGPRGAVITAIEELTRTRLQHVAAGGSTPRFRLDVGDYRESRRESLRLVVDESILAVRETGTPHVIDVVSASDRKAVHDRVAESGGDVLTKSEGYDPQRRVVIFLGEPS